MKKVDQPKVFCHSPSKNIPIYLFPDTNSLHEPPRRVLITLPMNKVMLSDYLFPGEGANDAFISLSELLDISLQDKKNIVEVEGQAGNIKTLKKKVWLC